jgi:peptidoglycan/xylan/chitin deacetylase (PgdA/CDA1 family)
MNHPILVISLDFELHWGRFDKVSLQDWEQYYHTTREVVPQLLALFGEYKVEATWATVGMLMANGPEEWKHYSPSDHPEYQKPGLSAYQWFMDSPKSKSCLFAPELVQNIIDTPGQELASHTFAHYYTMEKGHSNHLFRADLMASKRIAREKYDKELTSLVFPRNQYSSGAIQVARKLGFSAIRTNPSDWFWKKPEKRDWLKKIWRASDSVLSLGNRTSYALEKMDHVMPLSLPASRFLRPFHPQLGAVNQLKIDRIKKEITTAAKRNEIYHIWWHPHNHGNFPDQSLQEVAQILDHFSACRDQYGMQALSMNSVSRNLTSIF